MGKITKKDLKVIAKDLIRDGYNILEKNYECKYGSIDIIFEDETTNTIIFSDVAVYKDVDKGLPKEYFGEKKRKKYEQVAFIYCRDNNCLNKTVRFDLISVLRDKDAGLIRHHVNIAKDYYK